MNLWTIIIARQTKWTNLQFNVCMYVCICMCRFVTPKSYKRLKQNGISFSFGEPIFWKQSIEQSDISSRNSFFFNELEEIFKYLNCPCPLLGHRDLRRRRGPRQWRWQLLQRRRQQRQALRRGLAPAGFPLTRPGRRPWCHTHRI